MPLAALYARVSSEEQSRPGLASIPHQLGETRKLAERDGIPVAAEYTDDHTGQTLDRPGLRALLDHLSDYSHVYAYAPDRLARRRRLILSLRDTLVAARVTLRLVHGDTSTLDPESGLYLDAIHEASAEAEIMRFRRRSVMGREQRARNGAHTGAVPLGYLPIRTPDGRTTGLAPDPVWNPFFAELERLFLGGHSYYRIRDTLAERGYLSPRTGRPYSINGLRYLIANPWHAGHVHFGRTTRPADQQLRIPNAHPPRWAAPAAVRHELQRRAALNGRGRWQRHRYTGLLICLHCGSPMTSHPKPGAISYRCSLHARHSSGLAEHDCRPNYIRETAVTAQLATWLERAADPAELDCQLAALAGTDAAALEADLARQAATLADLDRALLTLADRLSLVPAGALPAVQQKLNQFAEQRTTGGRRLAELRLQRERLPDPADQRHRLLAFSRDPATLLTTTAPETLLATLRPFFPAGISVSAGRLLLP